MNSRPFTAEGRASETSDWVWICAAHDWLLMLPEELAPYEDANVCTAVRLIKHQSVIV